MCALEVSPELHRLLHKDAQDPGHNCLVTQFQNHSLLSGFVPAVAPSMPEVSGVRLAVAVFSFVLLTITGCLPSRAPPAV